MKHVISCTKLVNFSGKKKTQKPTTKKKHKNQQQLWKLL